LHIVFHARMLGRPRRGVKLTGRLGGCEFGGAGPEGGFGYHRDQQISTVAAPMCKAETDRKTRDGRRSNPDED
jgi:hypothetical protein